MQLPSAVAVDLSIGVVTRKSGDLAVGVGVMSRTVELMVWAVAVVVLCVAVSNGKGIVCVGRSEIEDRIWRTVVGITAGWAGVVVDGDP